MSIREQARADAIADVEKAKVIIRRTMLELFPEISLLKSEGFANLLLMNLVKEEMVIAAFSRIKENSNVQ